MFAHHTPTEHSSLWLRCGCKAGLTEPSHESNGTCKMSIFPVPLGKTHCLLLISFYVTNVLHGKLTPSILSASPHCEDRNWRGRGCWHCREGRPSTSSWRSCLARRRHGCRSEVGWTLRGIDEGRRNGASLPFLSQELPSASSDRLPWIATATSSNTYPKDWISTAQQLSIIILPQWQACWVFEDVKEMDWVLSYSTTAHTVCTALKWLCVERVAQHEHRVDA